MNQSQPKLDELEEAIEREGFLYQQFRTQLRNLHLAYIHVLTQSKYKLEFFDNGAIKSISPSGETDA